MTACEWKKDVKERCEEGAAPGLELQDAVNPNLMVEVHEEGKSQL